MDKTLILNAIKTKENISTNKDFAEFLGIKATTLSMWYKRNTFDIELVFTKCEYLNPEWLLTGKGKMLKNEETQTLAEPDNSKSSIPLLPLEAFAGIGSDVDGVSFNTIEERYVIPLFKDIQVDFMVSVRGSSMYPKYSSGDVVACRLIKEQLYIQWNKVYVIDTISQGVIMKRLKKSDNEKTYICKSDNKDYEPFEIPKKDIRNIALVTGVIRLE